MCTAAEIRPDIKLTAGKPAAPVASGGPGSAAHSAPSPPLGGGGEEVVWETSPASFHCYFYLIHSHPPTPPPPPVFLLVLSIFSLCSDYIFLSRSALLLLSSPFSLCLSTFEVISPGLTPAPLFFLPSFRTLSPCHFLFPVRQLSFFLFLCYQNGQVPCLLSVTWPSSRSTNASLLLVKPSKPKPPSFMSFNPVSGHQR